MPSDKKIEGILMPMPVAFKQDGAIDHGLTDLQWKGQLKLA